MSAIHATATVAPLKAPASRPPSPPPRGASDGMPLYSLVLLDTGLDGITRLFRRREAAERHVLHHLQKAHQYPGVAFDPAMMRFWIHHRGLRVAWNISEHRSVIE